MNETETKFDLIVRDLNAPAEKGKAIAETLQMYFDKHSEYDKLIKELVITDVNDTGKMAMAREGRLDLRRKRIEAEKLVKDNRDRLKIKMSDDILEDKLWLKSGQLIVALFDDLETKLLEKEKFAENEFKRQKKELADQRRKLLEPYQDYVNVMAYDLENMPEDQFQMTLKGIQHSYEEKQKQIREQKEKTERLERRKNELLHNDLMFDGTSFYIFSVDGKINITHVEQINNCTDEEFLGFIETGKILIEKERQRQADRDAELQKIKEENELRDRRLNMLSPAKYHGIPPSGQVMFNNVLVMSDEILIGADDKTFDTLVVGFKKMVQVEEERQNAIALHKMRSMWIEPYIKYVTKPPEDYSKLTEKQWLEMYDSVKTLYETEKELDLRKVNRTNALFGIGLNFDGVTFTYEDIVKISLDDVLGQAPHVFDVTFKAIQSKVEKRKSDVEEERLRNEKLETGSDKQKLQHLCDSWSNYKSELVLKTKKAQAILKRFDVNFGIAVSNLKGDIEKL